MAQEERYGTRDMSYSAWHRRGSTRRYVGIELAQSLAMIDLDGSLWVEYDDRTQEPLFLIETAMDIGQSFKNYKVTRNLARRANMPCFVVLYKLSTTQRNPAKPECMDIESFRVKRMWPLPEDREWRTLTPKQWAEMLVSMRRLAAGMVDAIWQKSQPVMGHSELPF